MSSRAHLGNNHHWAKWSIMAPKPWSSNHHHVHQQDQSPTRAPPSPRATSSWAPPHHQGHQRITKNHHHHHQGYNWPSPYAISIRGPSSSISKAPSKSSIVRGSNKVNHDHHDCNHHHPCIHRQGTTKDYHHPGCIVLWPLQGSHTIIIRYKVSNICCWHQWQSICIQ